MDRETFWALLQALGSVILGLGICCLTLTWMFFPENLGIKRKSSVPEYKFKRIKDGAIRIQDYRSGYNVGDTVELMDKPTPQLYIVIDKH